MVAELQGGPVLLSRVLPAHAASFVDAWHCLPHAPSGFDPWLSSAVFSCVRLNGSEWTDFEWRCARVRVHLLFVVVVHHDKGGCSDNIERSL